MQEPPMTLPEAMEAVGKKPNPRVTIESIKDKIAEVRYLWDYTLTIAVVEMSNGFKVVGKAAPAHPENFDIEVGKRYAFEDAIKQLWHLEGYLLCENLHHAKATL